MMTLTLRQVAELCAGSESPGPITPYAFLSLFLEAAKEREIEATLKQPPSVPTLISGSRTVAPRTPSPPEINPSSEVSVVDAAWLLVAKGYPVPGGLKKLLPEDAQRGLDRGRRIKEFTDAERQRVLAVLGLAIQTLAVQSKTLQKEDGDVNQAEVVRRMQRRLDELCGKEEEPRGFGTATLSGQVSAGLAALEARLK